MVCKYCGQEANTTDEYGEDVCSDCLDFFEANPTPPIPAPAGSTLVNVNIVTCEVCGGPSTYGMPYCPSCWENANKHS
jgi:predicted amidophosphoribosyltransferase